MKALLWLLLSSCAGEAPPGACASFTDCAADEVCDEGSCRILDCSTAESCPLGQTCADHSCVEGCEADADCQPGDRCDAGSCAPRGCLESAIDCAVGQICEEGACADAGVCAPCAGANACDADEVCLWLGEEIRAYCWQRCEVESDCPSGFGCLDVPTQGTRVCTADCDWLGKAGWL